MFHSHGSIKGTFKDILRLSDNISCKMTVKRFNYNFVALRLILLHLSPWHTDAIVTVSIFLLSTEALHLIFC